MSYHPPAGLEDFDATRYAALEDFNYAQWAELIESRIMCERLINAGKKQPQLEGSASNPFSLFAELLIKFFFDAPLTPLRTPLQRMLLRKDLHIPSVAALSVSDIFTLHRGVMEFAPITVSVQNNEIHYETPGDESLEIFDTPIDVAIARSTHYKVPTLARFQIDLQASDKEIYADFKKLLASYRERSSFSPPTITEAKLRQWARNRVLPYADLKLWEQWSNLKLKKSDFVELLFSDRDEITNRPLDSTQRDYDDAISLVTVTALRQTQHNWK